MLFLYGAIAGVVLAAIVAVGIAVMRRPIAGVCVTYDPAPAGGLIFGTPYFLGKTVLKLTVNYTLREVTELVDGVARGTVPQPVATFIKSVQIQPLLMPDERYRLQLTETALDDVLLDSSTGIGLSDDGVLLSVNSTMTDKSSQVVQSLLNTAVLVGKAAVAEAAEDTSWTLILHERIRAAYQELAEAAQAAGTTTDQLRAIQARIDVLQTALKAYRDANKPTFTDRDVTFVAQLDPTRWTPPESIIQLTDPEHRVVPPRLRLRLDLAGSPTSAVPEMKRRPGVIYRVPCPVPTTVELDRGATWEVLLTQNVLFAQFGPLAAVDVRGRRFTTRTAALQFSAQTGGLKQITQTSTSTAADALGTLHSAVEALGKQAQQLKLHGASDTRLARLEEQVAHLQSEQTRQKQKQAVPGGGGNDGGGGAVHVSFAVRPD